MKKTVHPTLWKRRLIQLMLLLIGNAIDAMGIALFILPGGFIVSGATGMGRILNYVLHGMLNVSVCVLIFNVLLFLLAWRCMGKHMAATIVIGTFTFPVFLDIFQHIPAFTNLTDNPLISMIFGAMCLGVGTGIVIRAGGSTGGADVIPIILHGKKDLPIAPVMYALDCIIMLFQIPWATKEQILLGILTEFITAIVLDKVQVIGGGEVQFLIFSRKSEEINRELLMLDAGTTLLHGQGGYRGRDEDVIICIVSSRKMREIKDAVLDIDPIAFMTISSVQEVSGRGFSLDRKTGLV